MVTVTERDKLWRESQHKANGRKRFTLQKLPNWNVWWGGCFYDSEGRLRLLAEITGEDYRNLFSSRPLVLVFRADPVSGEEVVVDLSAAYRSWEVLQCAVGA